LKKREGKNEGKQKDKQDYARNEIRIKNTGGGQIK
jgi:hypothetical protein